MNGQYCFIFFKNVGVAQWVCGAQPHPQKNREIAVNIYQDKTFFTYP